MFVLMSFPFFKDEEIKKMAREVEIQSQITTAAQVCTIFRGGGGDVQWLIKGKLLFSCQRVLSIFTYGPSCSLHPLLPPGPYTPLPLLNDGVRICH